ncbi:UNKNOWN [Stylonychia lemnae]|uniref:Uncharacterized protein n=1 Tax=Stylonychia lemnae TaxID=5949 RepID=A0A078AJV2_STYLE|nr:UNKNOWN [Stylonychia lemnae]|eukprot:CDW81742.1 UNKNOWN [Stylonychia lemnae]
MGAQFQQNQNAQNKIDEFELRITRLENKVDSFRQCSCKQGEDLEELVGSAVKKQFDIYFNQFKAKNYNFIQDTIYHTKKEVDLLKQNQIKFEQKNEERHVEILSKINGFEQRLASHSSSDLQRAISLKQEQVLQESNVNVKNWGIQQSLKSQDQVSDKNENSEEQIQQQNLEFQSKKQIKDHKIGQNQSNLPNVMIEAMLKEQKEQRTSDKKQESSDIQRVILNINSGTGNLQQIAVADNITGENQEDKAKQEDQVDNEQKEYDNQQKEFNYYE